MNLVYHNFHSGSGTIYSGLDICEKRFYCLVNGNMVDNCQLAHPEEIFLTRKKAGFFIGNFKRKEVNKKMKRVAVLITVFALLLVAVPAIAAQPADKGFDEFGYNYQARVFVGPADGVDRVSDGAVWGDPFYNNDHLVMKWSKGWDDARFHGAPWTPEAWEDNEWNGMVPGGSGEVWHYKIIWVGQDLETSPYWRDGGYAIWGQFEVILSQGTADGEHIWEAHAIPSGYGGN